jgi:hypothetical protein
MKEAAEQNKQRCENRCLRYSVDDRTHIRKCDGVVISGCGEDACVFEWIKTYGCASHSSAVPASSEPAPDYRELFVADLISLIRWDANHGNPELFKAVHQIQHHYAKPFSQQLIEHDERIRQEERQRVLDEVITIIRAPEECAEAPSGWLWQQPRLVARLESLRRGGEP